MVERNGMKKLGRDGFTLTEVMVTLLLSVFVVSALLWSSLGNRRTGHTGMIYAKAMMTARTYVEQIKALDYSDVANDFINGVTISDNATPEVTDDVTGDVTITVTDNGNSTKTVEVVVDWDLKGLGADAQHQVGLTTMVSDL